LLDDLKASGLCSFAYAIRCADNVALLRHVSDEDWFKAYVPSSFDNAYFYERLGASRDQWMHLLEDYADMDHEYYQIYDKIAALTKRE
jgi:hypothetical protein